MAASWATAVIVRFVNRVTNDSNHESWPNMIKRTVLTSASVTIIAESHHTVSFVTLPFTGHDAIVDLDVF